MRTFHSEGPLRNGKASNEEAEATLTGHFDPLSCVVAKISTRKATQGRGGLAKSRGQFDQVTLRQQSFRIGPRKPVTLGASVSSHSGQMQEVRPPRDRGDQAALSKWPRFLDSWPPYRAAAAQSEGAYRGDSNAARRRSQQGGGFKLFQDHFNKPTLCDLSRGTIAPCIGAVIATTRTL